MTTAGKLVAVFLFLQLAALGRPAPAWADEVFDVDPALSRITGSIHYSVIGRYTAEFRRFDGRLYYDPQRKVLTGVDLWIENDSLHSGFPKLDKIVLSPQLLDAAKYPRTLFKSKKIRHDKGRKYTVRGELTLHGVTREYTFPFTVDGPVADQNNFHITAHGKWVIPRKEFGIIWNPLLDVGGILVGNHMTVTWEISAFKKPEKKSP